jgi:hypothetical protein
MKPRLAIGLAAAAVLVAAVVLLIIWKRERPLPASDFSMLMLQGDPGGFAAFGQEFWSQARIPSKQWEVGTLKNFSPEHLGTADFVFYFGHGTPATWDSADGPMDLKNLRLSRANAPTSLRYLWQCSCWTFAQGPMCKTGLDPRVVPELPNPELTDYACQDRFGADLSIRPSRNVFQTWGAKLNSEVRIVCGSSTQIRCERDDAINLWDNYFDKKLDVADSFIVGLRSFSFFAPACLALGSSSPKASPLYDERFNPAGNAYPRERLYLEYAQDFKSNPPLPRLSPDLDRLLHALQSMNQVEAPRDHPRGRDFRQNLGPQYFGPPAAGARNSPGGDPCGKPAGDGDVSLNCGAGLLDAPKPLVIGQETSDAEENAYLLEAGNFVRQRKWCYLPDEKVPEGRETYACGKPRAFGLIIDAVPAVREGGAAAQRPSARYRKSVMVVFKRQPRQDDVILEELDSDGTILVQLDNHVQVIRATRRWTAARVASVDQPRTDAQSLDEALRFLPDEVYRKAPRFDLSGLVRLDEGRDLVAVHQYLFMPLGSDGKRLQPLTVEVPIDSTKRLRLLER